VILNNDHFMNSSNTNGWLTNIADGGTTSLVSYEHDAAGRRTKRTVENNTFTVYDYDNASQLTNLWHRQINYNRHGSVLDLGHDMDSSNASGWLTSWPCQVWRTGGVWMS
jgi:YD repeat-containing protein